MSGLRERKKARRREAILDAALELLGSADIQSVTLEQIADRAEVSPPTIYNLIGTREELLVALLGRVIEGLVDALSEKAADDDADPIAAARLIVDQSAAAFVAESEAYRQIVRTLGQLSWRRSSFDPSELQVRAMRDAQAQGIVRDDLDATALGRQIYLAYCAAMYAWAAHRASSASQAAEHGRTNRILA